jgi:hypothetical protein
MRIEWPSRSAATSAVILFDPKIYRYKSVDPARPLWNSGSRRFALRAPRLPARAYAAAAGGLEDQSEEAQQDLQGVGMQLRNKTPKRRAKAE